MSRFRVQQISNWSSTDVLRFMLGLVQSDGSTFFSLRMSQSFTTGLDGKPRPNTSWTFEFGQNLNANVLLELQNALMALGLDTDYRPRENRGVVRFIGQIRVQHLFVFINKHLNQPWFMGQKARNILLMQYVLDHYKTITTAQLVGLYFSQHKNHCSEPDIKKLKWTRKKVCKALDLSLIDVDRASKPILKKIDAQHKKQQDQTLKSLKKNANVLSPFFIIGFYTGDGITYLEKPTFNYDRNKQPYIGLVPCIGFTVETSAVKMLDALRLYFKLPDKKYTLRAGSYEMLIRSQNLVNLILQKLSDNNHKNVHIHKIRVAQLNLIWIASQLRLQTNNHITDYEKLEKLMAESFRVAFESGTYKSRTYTYQMITQAMAKHLNVSLNIRKPYSFYVVQSPPKNYLTQMVYIKPIEVKPPPPVRLKKKDPSGRGKAIVAYGLFFQTMLEAEKFLKPLKANLTVAHGEKIANSNLPSVTRRGLGRKLANSKDFDVVYPWQWQPLSLQEKA